MMNARCIAWLIPLALAVVAEVGAACEDEPLPVGAEALKAPDAAQPLEPEGGAPAPRPTNLSDYVYTTDEAIQLFELRVQANPRDFTSYATLGDLYERKARETDDLICFARAEEALRKALELFPNYARAQVSLAVVLCDRHKFAEALEVAQAVTRANPRNMDALATVGDAQLELGRYDEAEPSLRELVRRLPEVAPALARLAHLEELKGHSDEALQLVRRSLELLRKRGAGLQDLAWYQFREADMLFNAGRVDEAGKVAEEVLKAVPKHHDATATLARVRAAQGRTSEAIELWEKAVAIAPEPAMLVALGDLYALTGDADRARSSYDRMVKASEGQAEYRRVLSSFYADHDRDLPRALELAQQDFEQRKDIYGYDTLAWAFLKNGRAEEAAKAMTEALKLGTQDARLFFHAGMISHRLGDPSKGARLSRPGTRPEPAVLAAGRGAGPEDPE